MNDEQEAEIEKLRAKVAAVKALLSPKPEPVYDADNNGSFEGFAGGAEHRTVGTHRAWCHGCTEWCYPSIACSCCWTWIGPDELLDALATGDAEPRRTE